MGPRGPAGIFQPLLRLAELFAKGQKCPNLGGFSTDLLTKQSLLVLDISDDCIYIFEICVRLKLVVQIIFDPDDPCFTRRVIGA
jgi:hypothetical protein